MLFMTNRVLRQSVRTRINRPVTMDLRDNSAGQHLFFCFREDEETYLEIGSEAFMDAIRKHPAQQVLFYIHGYSNLPEPHIFPRATMLQTLFDQFKPNLVQVVPVIWPCDNDLGVLKDYFDDQQAADASAFAFSRVLGKFDDWRMKLEADDSLCTKRINILAHSMGNRVLRGAVYEWVKYDQFGHPPLLFRNIFMVAADVKYDTFEEGRGGRYLPDICRNLVVYLAADDLAMRASKAVNPGNRITSLRLGHKGLKDMTKVPNNVFAVDCDQVNTTCDPPMGHSYFVNNGSIPDQLVACPTFFHIASVLKTGRVQANPDRTWDIEDVG